MAGGANASQRCLACGGAGRYFEQYCKEIEGDPRLNPEFSDNEKLATETLWLRNLNSALYFDIASAGISPTLF